MLILPMTVDGARQVDIDLGEDRGVFTFRTYWNYTTETWNMDIYDSFDLPVILGLALVINIDILNPYPDVSARLGSIHVADLTGTANRTTVDLGVNSQVVSFTEGEYETLFPTTDTLPNLIIDIGDIIP